MIKEVLFVESDIDMLFLHRRFLGKLDPSLRFIEAKDALEVFGIIETNHIETVVTRYELGLNQPTGIDIIKTLKHNGQDTPSILILNSGKDIALSALREGAAYYIELDSRSPIIFYQELVELIKKAVNLHSERRKHLATQGRIDALYKNPSVGIARLDDKMHVTESSKTTRGMMGLSSEEIELRTLSSLLVGQTPSALTHEGFIKGEHTIIESQIVSRKDISRWIRITLSKNEKTVHDEVVTMALFEDISKRVELEYSTEDMIGVIGMLTDHFSVCRMLLDKDMSVISINQKWLDALEYSRENMVGRPISDFIFREEENLSSQKGETTDKEELQSARIQFLKKDGQTLEFVVSSRTMRDKAGQPRVTCLISNMIGEDE